MQCPADKYFDEVDTVVWIKYDQKMKNMVLTLVTTVPSSTDSIIREELPL